MADLSFILYDTALFSTTDEVDHVLFQVSEGADSTHVKAFTNARGAGVLPSSEKFTIKRLEVAPNENLSEADAAVWWVDGYVSVEVQNQEVFRAPLTAVVGGGKYSGHFTQATAANRNLTSFSDEGFTFEIPVEIPGGVPFKVILHQGTALAGTNQAIVCMLHGTLTRA